MDEDKWFSCRVNPEATSLTKQKAPTPIFFVWWVIPRHTWVSKEKRPEQNAPLHVDLKLQKPLVIGRIFLKGSGFIFLDVGKFPNWGPSDPDYKNISYHGLPSVVKMAFFLLFLKWEAIKKTKEKSKWTCKSIVDTIVGRLLEIAPHWVLKVHSHDSKKQIYDSYIYIYR